MTTQTGLDRLSLGDQDILRYLRGRRVGLLAHPASVDRRLRHARDVLADAQVDVRALFGPEHGYGGEAQDMVGVETQRSSAGPPVYSLYGDREEDLSPDPAWLSDLDVVVVDLQDVGSRYYTYVWTAVCMLRVAAAAGVETCVLDRPNPLGGAVVEGAPQRPGYRSFVGLCDVPVRHGLTIGEVCRLTAARDGLATEALSVATMSAWTRTMDFADTGLPWVLPSPNMPTLDTARVYPGGCLLEGTLLSEGRGTTRPFEIFGAPYVDGHELARRVSGPGVHLRPLSFSPTFHKHARERCCGVQVHIREPAACRTYALYQRAIAELRRQAGDAMAWRTEVYEFVSEIPAIDLLTGGPEFRACVDSGGDLEELLRQQQAAADAFVDQYRDIHLYGRDRLEGGLSRS
ncbi:MAG: DUF1343 domain-containing protein [Myxococcales bacterium]|nr:DUF1343 domain-containing protein [Myxococcales bacterium]MDD9966905.1 DUF1343 domain-containing protein [Myxococcales bacterium]